MGGIHINYSGTAIMVFIAREARYVYILSRQKFIKNAKNGLFCRGFSKPEACGQTVLPDRTLLIGITLVPKCQNSKI